MTQRNRNTNLRDQTNGGAGSKITRPSAQLKMDRPSTAGELAGTKVARMNRLVLSNSRAKEPGLPCTSLDTLTKLDWGRNGH